jgi:hypothetical protein
MKRNANRVFSKGLRRVAIAIVATGSVAAPAAFAKPSNSLIVVQPTDLPELARQTGEAMFLHETVNGRTLLYIEHNQGAELAILDVTDPAHVKGKGTVQIDAAGPFDFVSPLGDRAELIRFRQGHGEAVLNLPAVGAPTLKQVQGLTLQGPTMTLGDDGFTVGALLDADAQSARDYQVVDTEASQEMTHVVDVKQVREDIAKTDTGTTFLLAEGGLYVVRRPAVERAKKLHDLDRELDYAHGGG